MQGTTTPVRTRRQRFAYELDSTAFYQLVKAFHGEKREGEIGEMFGYNDSEWSLIKNGLRYVPMHMLAICTHDLFPSVLLSAYTNKVPFKPRAERS